MYAHSYLNTAKLILQKYDGGLPLSLWLKDFFKKEKKYGSRDRKQIAHLCYCYFRLGKSLMYSDVEKKIIYSLFLCDSKESSLLNDLDEDLSIHATNTFSEKIYALTDAGFDLKEVFPFKEELSSEIDYALFTKSFFIQPDLFLRIRPGYDKIVIQKLSSTSISFERVNTNSLALANSSKIEAIIELDKEAVVQDYNSQQVGELLSTVNYQLSTVSVWDCCAASGGKSILLMDQFKNIDLTVSDVRHNILHNLHIRFKRAGIKNYKSFVADLSHSPLTIHHSPFDLIICDAPCTGSGTWSRTPEQLSFFKEEKINYYADLQKKITLNASKALKRDGYFLYITCSVFRKENEEVVEYIQENTSLQFKSMKYFKGYDIKADTLFVALFTL